MSVLFPVLAHPGYTRQIRFYNLYFKQCRVQIPHIQTISVCLLSTKLITSAHHGDVLTCVTGCGTGLCPYRVRGVDGSRAEHITVESYTVVICQQSYILLLVFHHPLILAFQA